MSDRDLRLKSACIESSCSLFVPSFSSVVAPRIELGTTQLSAASGRPALDYRFIFPIGIASAFGNLRTFLAVVREAFESSPTGLQPIALPLELPNQICLGLPLTLVVGHKKTRIR